MLMALGPFRFTVPTFTVDTRDRSTSGRIAHSEVIGADQPTHLLGPGPSTITLSTTFHPMHLNRAGGAMLEAVRLACAMQTPLTFVSILGAIFGRWIIESVDSGETQYAPNGQPQTVTATIKLTRYVGRAGGAR
ncbi:phage tail protein [Aurantimonas sp. DM33-3]|uniref:phage tail protein n=1 Tax=Aurantimonas sp. DM33-3 TaxID=2766955 RepID=UPI001651EFFA|nr:phage tail protein [Aurantimonas sp. DM33-3]MBC6714806.1 phage tail protein [Aurantimonas sp. DM33-3]